MKIRIKNIIMLLMCISLSFFCPFRVSAEETGQNTGKDDVLNNQYDYYISDFSFAADVDEDNTWHITENITYNFVTPHHGPVRNIIYASDWYSDGETVRVPGKVSNFKTKCPDASSETANTSYGESNKSKYVSYSVGSKDKTYTGIHTYTMTYDLQFFTDLDEINFNIVGVNWQRPIENASWTIHMPKSFDASKIGYSVGKSGASGYNPSLLSCKVDGTTITGQYKSTLQMYEGINIRCKLPEGYFNFQPRNDLFLWVIFAVCSLPLIYMVIRGKQHIVPVVSFYPPDDLDPAEMERIYTGGDINHATALIPYLANKGYMMLTAEENQGAEEIQQLPKFLQSMIEQVQPQNEMTFTALNEDYSELSEYSKTFLQGLFEKGKTVRQSALTNRFYKTIRKMQSIASSNESELWDKKKNRIGTLSVITSFIAIVISVIGNGYVNYEDIAMENVLRCLFVGICCVTVVCISRLAGRVLGFFFIVPTLVFIFQGGGRYSIIPVILLLLNVLLSPKYTYRSEETKELYGKILGFKEFLETAEADRLRMLACENPDYFYDILGYAYVFGLEEKWMKRFDSLQLIPETCDWYQPAGGAGVLSASALMDSFHSVMQSASYSMNSNPSSSSGSSGSSGGGCSGGGGGGGGGGAW
jgi:uncharacterized membrane protein YgcG